MIKAFLSFIVTNLAILVLSIAFMAWVLDATLLQPNRLLPALKESGTGAALTKAIPELIQAEGTGNSAEAQLVREKVTQLVTQEYVDQKLTQLVTSFSSYIKTGQPEPSLDLRDLPPRLQATGLELPPELLQHLNEPIKIKDQNSQNAFAQLRQGYQLLQIVKYAGIVVGLLLLVADWFLADRGKKAMRIGNVFVSVGIWSGVYWYIITNIPGVLVGRFDGSPQGAAMAEVAASILKGASQLMAQYFKVFAFVCLGIAVLAYILHFALKRFGLQPPRAVPSSPPATLPKPVARKR